MNDDQLPALLPFSGLPGDPRGSAARYAGEAFSPHTRRVYAGQWKLWLRHCQATGSCPLPASPNTVADWVAYRADAGRAGGKRAAAGKSGHSLATLRAAVAAIRCVHMAEEVPFDSRHPALVVVLRGIARSKREAQAQAEPLRADMIVEILGALGDTALERRDAALLALGYCFARRRSELAGLDYREQGQGDGVFQLGAKQLVVKLFHSKSNVGGEEETYVTPREQNSAAADAIERWIALARVKRREPVLRRVHKSGVIGRTRLDPQSISLVLRSRLQQHFCRKGMPLSLAREEARRYSAHSLRVGFAVTAAEAGADVGAIQQALGHSTPAMATRYARPADRGRRSPHHLPGVGLRLPGR